MSEESAKAFIDKASSDTELAAELDAAASADARLAIAKAAGFEFTREEFEAARGHITEAELESVAAGRECNCGWKDFGF
ncbi:MAG: Nif11-like leader peptide family natural product precursor [Chloroflexi bacterium]|nr:Nif11-like leader peptide family natural product precursor [Chloroflexota bacterium]